MTDSGPPDGVPDSGESDVRTVARGGAVQIAGQITQRSLTFFFTAVLVRVVGTPLYGLYREITQILAIAAQLGLLGFNYAAMRFIARARAADDHGAVKGTAMTALTATGVASLVVTLLLLVLAGFLAGTFAEPGTEADDFVDLMRIGAAYVPLYALMQVLRYCTQAYKTMVPSVVAGNIVQPSMRFLLGVAALSAGYAVTGAVVTLLLSLAIGALVAGWYLMRMLTHEERAAAPAAQPRAMIRFAVPQAGASLLGVQTLGVGILLLGMLSTNREVGLFGIALSLQGPGTVFLGGVVNIWAPVVTDLHERKEIARLGSLYKTINRWIATFSLPVFAALILEADLFSRLYTGNEGAASVVAILAAGNIVYTSTGPTGYLISMTGHPGVNFFNSVVGVGLYVGLGALVLPEHGAVGIAVVDAAVTTLVNSARVVEAKVLVGLQPFGRSFRKPVIATLVAAAVLLAWRLVPSGAGSFAGLMSNATFVEIAGVIVAAAVYLLVLKAQGLDSEEREVLDVLRRRVRRVRGRRSS